MYEPTYRTAARDAWLTPCPDGRGWPDGMTVGEALATGATSERTGKGLGHTDWKGAGLPGSRQVFADARRVIEEYRPGSPSAQAPATAPEPEPDPDGPAFRFEQKGDGATLECDVYALTPPTSDELMARYGFDGDAWRVLRAEIREWTGGMKLKRREITDGADDGPTKGVVRLEDRPAIMRHYRCRLVLEPARHALALRELAADLLADLREEARARPAVTPLRRREKGPGHLVVLHAPDLHHGKVPLDGDWDGAAAFTAAVEYLLETAASYDTGRVLLTVGNDALNTDGSRRSTTRGTPQDGLGRWREEFRAVAAMYRAAIDRALEVAPVSVVVVPGNHDADACFYLGETIEATYAGNAHVAVTNSHRPRTYHLHGRCLLGMTHGDGCKITDLPRLMSEEAAQMWADAVCREWLTGHRHRLEVQTIGSCKVRTSDALSPTDDWHAGKGYTGVTRSAEALIYHPEAGRVGTLQAPLAALPLAA